MCRDVFISLAYCHLGLLAKRPPLLPRRTGRCCLTVGKKRRPSATRKSRKLRAAGIIRFAAGRTTNHCRISGRPTTSRIASRPSPISAAIVCAEINAIPRPAITACLIVSFDPISERGKHSLTDFWITAVGRMKRHGFDKSQRRRLAEAIMRRRRIAAEPRTMPLAQTRVAVAGDRL